VSELWRLGQLRHHELLTLAILRVPQMGAPTELWLARRSRDQLLDLLTRP
jgi:hypothetical protein